MCLAIFKPAKCVISEESLRNGWQGNSDGAGFAFVRNNKVQLSKGFMTVKEFLEGYNAAIKANRKSPFVVHFRIRSQGDKSVGNTHPFPIKGGVLIHNGNLEGTGSEYGKGKSDTALFAEKFADRLDYATVNAHKKEFSDAVGYNKIVLLYDDMKHVILNESYGHWDNDVWYSNRSYQSGSRSNWQSHRANVGDLIG
jgi:glutamine amidotransferase